MGLVGTLLAVEVNLRIAGPCRLLEDVGGDEEGDELQAV
jgi:hypothetical protein